MLRHQRLCLVILASLFIGDSVAFAQDVPIERVVAAGPADSHAISTMWREQNHGLFTPAEPSRFAFRGVASAARQSAPRAASGDGWVGRHQILLGTAIGAGGLALWEGAQCKGLSSCKIGTAALVGAGAGAYGGLIASTIHRVRSKQPVGRGHKIGLVAGAIGGAVIVFVTCYAAGGCGGVS